MPKRIKDLKLNVAERPRLIGKADQDRLMVDISKHLQQKLPVKSHTPQNMFRDERLSMDSLFSSQYRPATNANFYPGPDVNQKAYFHKPQMNEAKAGSKKAICK